MVDNDKFTRREFLNLIDKGIKFYFLSSLSFNDLYSQENSPISVEYQRQLIRTINSLNNKKNFNLDEIINNLTFGLSKNEGRAKLFEFVQSFPYEISYFKEGESLLLKKEKGDCRHKRELLYNLYLKYGECVRLVDVVYDWADLPIPKEILLELRNNGTKSLHDGLQVKINNEWVYIDPTWDPDLGLINFPVNYNWDGASKMNGVTLGENIIYPHPINKQEIILKNNIKFIKDEINSFNKDFNRYLRNSRIDTCGYNLPIKK